MAQQLIRFALLVDDYDRAIAWYTKMLDFEVIEDSPLSDTKRWVSIATRGSNGMRILLAKAIGARQLAAVGDQSGGRVFLFLETDAFQRDYHGLKAKGVEFVREAEDQPWGMVAVFKDLYGNLWDLIGPSAKPVEDTP